MVVLYSKTFLPSNKSPKPKMPFGNGLKTLEVESKELILPLGKIKIGPVSMTWASLSHMEVVTHGPRG
jgi:hypothetical protein